MPLYVHGTTIVPEPDVIELGDLLTDVAPDAVLTAMAAGGADVDPDDAFRMINTDLRFAAGTNDRAHDLLDAAHTRLITAFPDLWSG